MRNFSQFIKEEVTIKGNTGIPGEGKDKSEKDYLKSVERRARQKLGTPNEEDPRRFSRATIQIIEEMMEIMKKSAVSIRGKEDELEDLAKRIISSEYGSILDNVELDIKIIRPGDVKKFMDEEQEECEMPSYQLLKDPEIKKEVDKRKIINNITQGEAKNTKRIMSLPEVKDELKRIFGEAKGEELHKDWMRMTDLADKMDWIVPVDIKGDMMEQAPEGMAGACSVKWPDKKDDAESDKLAEDVLKAIENDEDISDNEDVEELFSDGNPIIKARGVDFPMLLHETVKGIYELIAAAGIPEDKRTAEIVIMNTSSFEDEAEEFRYGPEIAADIRDFINKSDNLDKYPNIREHFFGVLVRMEKDEFLHLVKSILMDTPEARKKVNEMIEGIISELDKYEYETAMGDDDNDDEKYGDDTDEFVLPNAAEKEVTVEKEKEEVVDYSKMSQFELNKLVDDALDAGDMEKVKELSKYLKEGREIFLREIDRINEMYKKNK